MMEKTVLQDSVVGGDMHSGNVIHNHYHVNEIKPLEVTLIPKMLSNLQEIDLTLKKKTSTNAVKKQRPKNRGIEYSNLWDIIKVVFYGSVFVFGTWFLVAGLLSYFCYGAIVPYYTSFGDCI